MERPDSPDRRRPNADGTPGRPDTEPTGKPDADAPTTTGNRRPDQGPTGRKPQAGERLGGEREAGAEGKARARDRLSGEDGGPAGRKPRVGSVGGKAGVGKKLGGASERLGAASKKVGSAGRKVGQASKVGASGFAAASKKTAGFTGRAGRATGKRIRGLTSAQGAGESGLSRLIELGAVNAAGDTAFAVSLAGTVFFAAPGEARNRVALFLLLTMAPFALMAPLIGPILDRFRHGRRWAIGTTLGLRGFLVWSLAASIQDSSTWLYPAALGCLVASKAYGVTRASAVPRLLPKEISLVTANSRISLAGVAGATVGAGIAGAFAAIGPQWSLRWAALVYTIGLILAIRLPSRVDSPAGEEMTGTEGRETRRRVITAAVSRGIRCNLGLRFVSGFLTMYLAFLLRDEPLAGIDGALAAGAVIAAAGIGNSLGTLLGSLLKARKPEAVVLAVLLADATVAVCVAVLYGFPILIVLGLVAGLCSSLGKLSLDAMIQRDVPETVRTSVFARSETVLQLSWVIGGGCGIVMPLIPRLGFGFLAAVLVLVVILVVRHKPSDPAPGKRPPHPTPTSPPEPGTRRESAPSAQDRAQEAASRTRTIMTRTEPTDSQPTVAAERISERRARYNEPTVELRFDPFADADSAPPGHDGRRSDPTVNSQRKRLADDQHPGDRRTDGSAGNQRTDGNAGGSRSTEQAGRWWSGQPDDDETVEDEQPWAAEPTVERRPNPFRRHRPDPDSNKRRP